MIRDEIARMVEEAVDRAKEAGDLPAVALPEIVIERPQRLEHGDYATSLPLRLARAAGAKPIELGQTLARHMPPSDAIGRVEVAPPGCVNFHLNKSRLAQPGGSNLRAGRACAQVPWGTGRRREG